MTRRLRAAQPATPKIINQDYELVAVDTLLHHPQNPRRGNVQLIRKLMRANGFFGVLLVQKSTRFVLKGNHTLMAAREEGLEEVPVIWLDVDDERAAKIVVSDNAASDDATNDPMALVGLLNDLEDLDGTGYTDADLAALLKGVTAPDEFPDVDPETLDTKHECPQCGYSWS